MKLSELFKRYDTNNSGKLERDEVTMTPSLLATLLHTTFPELVERALSMRAVFMLAVQSESDPI